MLSLVVAAADNDVIGINNTLPWRLPVDLARFKQLTMGKPILMGRKTFDSLGRVLPGRPHIVITRQRGLVLPDNCHAVGSLQEAIVKAQAITPEGEWMVIGGGDIYAQALPLADRVYLTRVHLSPAGDTWFPALDTAQWQLRDSDSVAGDPACTFLTYQRHAATA